jgi:hypothetical protein
VIVWIGHICLGVGNSEETAWWPAPKYVLLTKFSGKEPRVMRWSGLRYVWDTGQGVGGET